MADTIYYNQRPPARRDNLGTYLDMPSTPLYAFGEGLSYTTYSYGELHLSSTIISDASVPIRAEIEVSNTGLRDGMETILWFVSDPVCSIARPVKELRHFEKISLRAGETRIVTFDIDPLQDLGFVNDEGKRFLEAGDYYIEVAGQRVKVVVEDCGSTHL